MSTIDELVRNNSSSASGSAREVLPARPARRVAVVACMDARLVISELLGLEEGDAHVIRNAGGVVTEDVIRSLTISQWLLGTREIMLVLHTDCGMMTFTDERVKELIREKTGVRPPFAFHSFRDLEEAVRRSLARIQASPFLPHKDEVRGFVYEVETRRLREVE